MKRIVLRKVTSVALSVVLACGLLPATALADSAQDADSGYGSSPAVGQAATVASDDVAAAKGEDSSSDSNAAETDGTVTGRDELLEPSAEAPANSDNAATAASPASEAPAENGASTFALTSTLSDGAQADNGYCGTTDNGGDGKNISWTYDGAGTLTLSGTGSTGYYGETDSWWGFSQPVPGWYSYRSSITNIEVGEGIETLDSAVFAGTSITSITLPSSVKEIGQLVFARCSKLRTVNLNEGLESIGAQVFKNTWALPSLYIPSTVSSIDSTMFRGIDLAYVTFSPSNPYFTKIDNVLYNGDVTRLIRVSDQFTGTLTLPSTVTAIDDCACEAMTGITQVVLPDGLKSIGAGAFNLSGLTSVDIPDSVTEIGRSAFQACKSMTHAKLGSGYKGSSEVEYNNMFAYNPNLTSVELSEGLEIIENGMFTNCESLTAITIPQSVKSIETTAFYGSGLTSVTLPDGLTNIGDSAFYGTKISSVSIPESAESIGTNAFPENVTINGPFTKMPDGSYKNNATLVTIEYDVTYYEQDSRSMLAMINDFRTGSDAWYKNTSGGRVDVPGLSTLAYDKNLEKIAQMRAAEIAVNFAHERPDGSDCFTATYNGISSSGENIAAGYGSAWDAFVGWREDNENYYGQGHRRNMLNSNFTSVGIGHVTFNGIDFWVQEFGTDAQTTSVSGSGSTYTEPYRISAERSQFTRFPESFTFPDNLGLETAGASTEFPYVNADKVSFQDTWQRAFSARIYPYLKNTDPSQVQISGNTITALVDGPTSRVIACIGGNTYPVAVSSYALSYTVGDEEYANGKVLVRYLSAVKDGTVPTLFGQPLVMTDWCYETLVDASDAKQITESSFSSTAASQNDPVMPRRGDVSGNGRVNVVDAQLAYDIACNRFTDYSSISMGGWLAANFNNDFVLDASDAFAIQRSCLRS